MRVILAVPGLSRGEHATPPTSIATRTHGAVHRGHRNLRTSLALS